MKQPGKQLRVHMLGRFSISCGEVQLSDDTARSKKVWLLIQYLITNRGSDLSVDRMILDIWGGEESDDPLNVLKNLVYRARNILKQLCPGETTEFILYRQNTYAWNPALDCEIDCEQFLAETAAAESASREERMTHYLRAIALYQGEFLPKSSYADWVIARATGFASAYVAAVEGLCPLLQEAGRTDEMVAVCENAASLYPLEERVHKQLLRSYVAAGRYSKAIHHYNYISELFYKELGVCLSSDIRTLYRDIISGISAVEMDLSVICEDLKESSAAHGAYFCDYEVFRNIYRVQARSISRTGQSVNIVLMTLTDHSGEVPEEKELKRAVRQLRDAVVSGLRRGDVVSAFSPSQLVIMLPMTNLEQAHMVANRLTDRFYQHFRQDKIRIRVNIRPLTPNGG